MLERIDERNLFPENPPMCQCGESADDRYENPPRNGRLQSGAVSHRKQSEPVFLWRKELARVARRGIPDRQGDGGTIYGQMLITRRQ
jgi:hypothetical protein